MTATAAPAPSRESLPSGEVLGRLVELVQTRGLVDLAQTLVALNQFVAQDLAAVELELDRTPTRNDLVGRSAQHLLDLKGKRLRPLCVALASRMGSGSPFGTRHLAAAVELVHNATLLHDDVIDLGDQRRGMPTARVTYGNAASVFAGDWLLIQALKHVRRSGVEGVLDRLLDIIDEMIEAEALQLELRGRLDVDRDAYFRVIEGKTASLFRWAMLAGGRSADLDWSSCESLARFGNDLGMAFQIVDDALDLVGETEATGKALFTDVMEGKMTLPLLIALERDPGMVGLMHELVAHPDLLPTDFDARLHACLRRTEAVEESMDTAQRIAERGRRHLETLPPSEARHGLELVAQVAVQRRS